MNVSPSFGLLGGMLRRECIPFFSFINSPTQAYDLFIKKKKKIPSIISKRKIGGTTLSIYFIPFIFLVLNGLLVALPLLNREILSPLGALFMGPTHGIHYCINTLFRIISPSLIGSLRHMDHEQCASMHYIVAQYIIDSNIKLLASRF